MIIKNVDRVVNEMKSNYSKEDRNKKDQIKCPQCGSKNTAEIIYGYPVPDEAFHKKLDEGKIALGGCCIRMVSVDGEQIMAERSRK